MNQYKSDTEYMKQALLLARSAAELGEVPVGAVLVLDGDIISKGLNCPIATHDPTGHAEIVALRGAAAKLANYRLPGTTLYVTLEPCIMCMGAIIHARIQRLVFGASDPKTGAAVSRYSIGTDKLLNHHIAITGGICETECSTLLKNFFREKRKNNQASK
ncbi:MAG: tRNA adenosine(34) deaminase TadA [Thermodesulfobacteriota bacterium]|nr:tRNA adenosine(34) deaminase TadA [Thermodesulfobacteriota bacterium]